MNSTSTERLATWSPDRVSVNVIVETPRGSRNKYEYDEETGRVRLTGVLGLGLAFPFDFGFIPGTKGGDGDPIDVLVLMDEAVFPGCVAECRLVGAITAIQTERDGRRERNDRLLAVANVSADHKAIRSINDIPSTLLEQIEHFFISYNEVKGKGFSVDGRAGPDEARKIVEQGEAQAR